MNNEHGTRNVEVSGGKAAKPRAVKLTMSERILAMDILVKVRENLGWSEENGEYKENYENWMCQLSKDDYQSLGKIINKIGGDWK
jgi:hypothetical protein